MKKYEGGVKSLDLYFYEGFLYLNKTDRTKSTVAYGDMLVERFSDESNPPFSKAKLDIFLSRLPVMEPLDVLSVLRQEFKVSNIYFIDKGLAFLFKEHLVIKRTGYESTLVNRQHVMPKFLEEVDYDGSVERQFVIDDVEHTENNITTTCDIKIAVRSTKVLLPATYIYDCVKDINDVEQQYVPKYIMYNVIKAYEDTILEAAVSTQWANRWTSIQYVGEDTTLGNIRNKILTKTAIPIFTKLDDDFKALKAAFDASKLEK